MFIFYIKNSSKHLFSSGSLDLVLLSEAYDIFKNSSSKHCSIFPRFYGTNCQNSKLFKQYKEEAIKRSPGSDAIFPLNKIDTIKAIRKMRKLPTDIALVYLNSVGIKNSPSGIHAFLVILYRKEMETKGFKGKSI